MELPFPKVENRPLTREEQKVALGKLQESYMVKETPIPVFPMAPVKDYKLSQEDQLRAAQAQFTERGMQFQVQKVEKQLEEKKTSTTINQFYCRHVYQAVNVKMIGIPVRYKVCQKCGLVK